MAKEEATEIFNRYEWDLEDSRPVHQVMSREDYDRFWQLEQVCNKLASQEDELIDALFKEMMEKYQEDE